jgi:hypothetical protein
MNNDVALNEFQSFLLHLCAYSNPETIFLIIDRKEDSVESSIIKIFRNCNICFSQISYPSSERSSFDWGKVKNFKMDPSENRAGLGKLYEELSNKLTPNHYPEGRGNVLWVLGRKEVI